ncbi:MAG: hypothetical protein KAH57_07255, partial [Thermoplasmata archaeon]|nr:hypothetical protein [Thermoplasmata archaeon]
MRHITMRSRWETDDEAQKPPEEDDRPKCPGCKIPLRKKDPVTWSCFLCEKEFRTSDLLSMREENDDPETVDDDHEDEELFVDEEVEIDEEEEVVEEEVEEDFSVDEDSEEEE